MIVIAGFYRFPVDQLDAVKPAMAQMIELSRAEPGCGHYAFAHDVVEPGLVRVSESWQDEAALKAHAASAHMAVWRAASAAHGIHDRMITAYDVTGSRPL
ncbi:antibiotic biosynthesis monooxygenase family protein [Blastomonas sp. RAC04]|uniref:putative quinol monooxygenase n=1 Tax=Blastomonas sp. RAC04 TaxID=1842535 RepID=UPI00083D998A|nr:antibiotic biosynthesis monooxygenase [Blastomonas sp. RAC04]AOG00779.1 antibiotic biosynthesis monooxygenase family protein [Blastomonas sp. RAC04]